MVMENMVTFQNCCSSHVITDRNLKPDRVVEKAFNTAFTPKAKLS